MQIPAYINSAVSVDSDAQITNPLPGQIVVHTAHNDDGGNVHDVHVTILAAITGHYLDGLNIPLINVGSIQIAGNHDINSVLLVGVQNGNIVIELQTQS